MPDLSQKVFPGDPLSFPARVYNELLDMLGWWKAQKSGRGRAPDRNWYGGTLVEVLNDTDEDLDPGAIVGLKYRNGIVGGTLAMPGLHGMSVDPCAKERARERPVYVGVTPAWPTYLAKWAVVKDGIGKGAIGLAVRQGLAMCRVDVEDTGHTYVDVTDGSTEKLTSRYFGGGRIVDLESVFTGDRWALVEVGGPWLPPIFGILDEPLPERGGSSSTDVHALMQVIRQNADGSLTGTASQIEVYDSGLMGPIFATGTHDRIEIPVDHVVAALPDLHSGRVNIVGSTYWRREMVLGEES